VTLTDGGRRIVRWDELTPQSSSIVVAKKGGGGPEYELSQPAPDAPHAMLSVGFGAGSSVTQGLALGLRVGFEPTSSHGLTFSLLGSYATGAQITEGGVQARAGYRFGFDLSRLWFGIGAEAGAGGFFQSFAGASGQSVAATFTVMLAARGSARLKLVGPLWLGLDLDLAGALLQVDQQWKIVPLPTAMLGVGFAL
jgi:hypothetical protein